MTSGSPTPPSSPEERPGAVAATAHEQSAPQPDQQPAATNGAGDVILEVSDIHTYYGSIHALKGVTLQVRAGEVVTLIGANGAGKSTTLRSINGLNHPRKGRIVFQGRDITNAPAHEVVKMGISQSPEGRRLFPNMSVLENLEMGAFQRTDRQNFKEDLDRVYALFPRLAERKSQRAGTLSGGEQQMVAMGRALMARPKLVMLDEPSMGLAPIFVEQNALMALDVAHRGYVMETGKIALTDEAKKLSQNEQVQKAYLGMD